jgi:hypothetical protein
MADDVIAAPAILVAQVEQGAAPATAAHWAECWRVPAA